MVMVRRCGLCNKFQCECPEGILIRSNRSYIQAWRSNAPPPLQVTDIPSSTQSGNSGQTHFHPRGLKHNRKLKPLR